MTLYVDWLPPATAAAALENDTRTFEAAALAFVALLCELGARRPVSSAAYQSVGR